MQTRTSSRFYSFYSRRKPPAAEAVILFISKKMLPVLYKGMYNFVKWGFRKRDRKECKNKV